jgi:hypothetical protein
VSEPLMKIVRVSWEANSSALNLVVKFQGVVGSILRHSEFHVGDQGVMGSIPWQGMVFFTLWLQLKGLSDGAAAGVYAMFLTGTAFGGALGGFLGDRASLVSPSHGRIFISQISVAMGLPLSFLIIKVLPFLLYLYSCCGWNF